MPEGLLILRLVVGLLLVAHGTQKLFGWYGGHGLAGTGGFFESLGFRPGRPMAMLAGASEAGGGLLLALGLLTPIGAAMIAGTMLVAALSAHAEQGLWATNGGYELPLVNATVAIALAFTGAGAWSLDNVLDIPWTRGWTGGLIAVALALVAGVATEARRRSQLAGGDDTAYPSEAAAATVSDPTTTR
jgi:putative oxidoreductase